MTFTLPSNDELTQRAMAAWSRACKRAGAIYVQPAQSSGVVKRGGTEYVHLHNVRETLAVYRIRRPSPGRATISALKEWSPALTA